MVGKPCHFYLAKYKRLATGMSKTSAISSKVSKEMEVGMLGASMLLIWVRLILICSAKLSKYLQFSVVCDV